MGNDDCPNRFARKHGAPWWVHASLQNSNVKPLLYLQFFLGKFKMYCLPKLIEQRNFYFHLKKANRYVR